ncbi:MULTISPECIES: DinB family protein [unclassified Ruegeria]|uniref:DinB family protein n=1 Tax=unclassified Ruegeria TaxID=2625375 RepID=UPI00148955FF|nr:MULTISPECIES: DinB family protein [unclassified Ruegeria]
MITDGFVREMATFSRWQNDTVYHLCDEIGDAERNLDRGMFFGSIHKTLDHICVVNRNILTFLNGALPERYASKGAVWPDWDDLKAVRLEQDELLSAGADEWTEKWLSAAPTKRDLQAPDLPTVPRWVMVVQIFHHQTHHRSQVTSALHAMGIDYGTTDIP